jgi:hypothetical protein
MDAFHSGEARFLARFGIFQEPQYVFLQACAGGRHAVFRMQGLSASVSRRQYSAKEQANANVQIINIGSRMAMIQGVLRRESDGQIISTSEHHLFNNDRNAKL